MDDRGDVRFLLLAGALERPVEDMGDDELIDGITIAQSAYDRLLNEIETRNSILAAGDRGAVTTRR